MSRRRKHGEAEDNSEIDLTPMLDVVFIMLIFFIVTASFVKESVIDTAIPPPNDQVQTDSENPSIVVNIRANDEIWMEDRRIDVRAVRANIERMHAENPKSAVVVRAHIKSTAKTYIAIADSAREADVYNIALVPYEDKK